MLVEYAFVRGVHVDEHQPVAVLRQDEDAVQLRQGKTEWMVVVVGQVRTVR